MFTVYNCIVHEHDLRLVVLAAVICALASFTAISILHHARKSTGNMWGVWLGVSATASGFGIWATHFIAMLAYSPGLPNGYNLALTLLSLLAAIALTGLGLAVALTKFIPGAAWFGGAIVGGGIATMHYTGMAAYEVEGRITWDLNLVIASIILGAAFGALALAIGLRDGSVKSKITGALILTVAICSHHFTAMGAVSIVPDPTVAVSESALPTSWLAIAVALASFTIILLAFAGVALDIRERRQAEREVDRMRGLANAAVEGLLVCDGEIIVTANKSFASLTGSDAEAMIDMKLSQFFPVEASRLTLLGHANQPVETELRHVDGSVSPVEVIQHEVNFGGKRLIAIAVRDLQARKKAEQHIRFMAHHDALTGLPNRASFNKKLDQEISVALATKQSLAVLCIDLDRFKEVNDLFGHAVGDVLLQTVATCVGGLLDDSQMMARLGGDEFAIIAPGLSNPGVAGRIAENIMEALRSAGEGSAHGSHISCSIGIAICPNDATDRQALLTEADTALYRAKMEGRGTYRFFEATMGAQVRDRRLLEHELRHAIARREMNLVYQPQTDIKSGEIVGFEALLRWNHPSRGNISPETFIPIAEECGTILQIGEWVLREACREAASWVHPLSIAVNVSAVQLHHADFSRRVHEVLIQTKLSPQRLEIEITETALVRDLVRALATLRQLKSMGIRIAMDDFGTGYSSLSNLRAFPFDKIKIDGSFIRSVDSSEQAATIVRAVLGLGRGLGLPVLAEGVETSDELKFLADELCDEAQGFLLGRPAQIESFRHLTHNAGKAGELPRRIDFEGREHQRWRVNDAGKKH
jgi:diguanylate cyclase (GGDEF)-like protein/PAS domain S-box-containing protein